LDAPDVVHHIMVRGLERRVIFRDDRDRTDFVERLGRLAEAGAWTVYAWALLPDHAHLLVRTAGRPLARNMRSLLTGYAGGFNRRYRRAGHLFQNRYKSIVVEEDSYFLTLVRYLHLNPLRAGVVADLRGLARYPWSGHATLLGRTVHAWQATAAVLGRFGRKTASARAAYQGFVAAGAAEGRRPELQGGGLVRSLGGWKAVQALGRGREGFRADERVLGTGAFVDELLHAVQEQPAVFRISLDVLVSRVCRRVGVRPEAVAAGSRRAPAARAREGIAYLWTEVCGRSGRQLVPSLGVSAQSVYKASARGRHAAAAWDPLVTKRR
jgi:REP element-mobilizing transposase RayT